MSEKHNDTVKPESKKTETSEKKKHVKFMLERDNTLVKLAMIILAFSFVLRIVGTLGMWSDAYFVTTQIALPLVATVVFMLFVWLFGKRAFWLTCLPVLMGVVFFIIKALSFENFIHTAMCITLYAIVAVVYTGTVFGLIPSKWPLVPLFGLPLIYHILVEDLAAFRDGTITFANGVQELSVLCIMLALLLVSLAVKKKKGDTKTAVDLPKIKAPVIVVNKQESGEEKHEDTEA